jgi:RNA polymerase sigma factor (sigma-70 family)
VAAGRIEVGRAAPLEGGARVAAVVARHEAALLRVARQASLCHDDALDAYQRALEIFVRRVDTVDPTTELGWLKVVVRHEALAIRRARSESVAGEDLNLDAFVPGPERPVEDQIAGGERVRRSAEALRALKPDEARALMMKAHGLSYEEIGKQNGWTYTKVNRAVTEGRQRFLRVYEGIESGRECERFAPIVEALAEGAATSAQVLEIRPHLRHCTACRATVRELHLSRLRRASLFWPLFAVVEPLRRLFERSPGAVEDVSSVDRLVLPDHLADDVRPIDELVPPDTIVPAPESLPGVSELPIIEPPEPAISIPDVGIQVPLPPDGLMPAAGERTVDPDLLIETGDRITRLSTLKHDLAALLHRTNASDIATGVHIAATTGGGRAATIGAVLGLCLSSIGAGTVCVVTGLLPDPLGIVREEPETVKPRADAPRRPARERAAEPPPTRLTAARPTPTATPAPRPPGERTPRTSVDPSQGTKPRSHENPPISPPATTASSQDSFTPEAPPPPSTPAAAPATGGSEFTP